MQASLFILGYTGASVLIGPVLSCSVDYNQAEKRVLQAVISCLWRYREAKNRAGQNPQIFIQTSVQAPTQGYSTVTKEIVS